MKGLFRTSIFAMLIAILLCGFTACQSEGGTTSTTPQSVVYSGKSQFDMALSFVVWYNKTLPLCPIGAPLCHTQENVDKLKVASNEVNVAVQNAEDLVRTPGYDPTSATGLQLTATRALTTLLQIVLDIEQQNPDLAKSAPKK